MWNNDNNNNTDNNREEDVDGDTNGNWCTWNDPQKIRKETEKLGNKRTSRDHPDYSIINIGQYTEKSPGDLRRLDVTQTSVKNR